MKYHNNMATSSLLGDSGLTGDFSVGEHAEVAQAIAKAVDTILFRVVPLESKGLDIVQYEKSNKTLTINYAFMQPLAQSTHIMQGPKKKQTLSLLFVVYLFRVSGKKQKNIRCGVCCREDLRTVSFAFEIDVSRR